MDRGGSKEFQRESRDSRDWHAQESSLRKRTDDMPIMSGNQGTGNTPIGSETQDRQVGPGGKRSRWDVSDDDKPVGSGQMVMGQGGVVQGGQEGWGQGGLGQEGLYRRELDQFNMPAPEIVAARRFDAPPDFGYNRLPPPTFTQPQRSPQPMGYLGSTPKGPMQPFPPGSMAGAPPGMRGMGPPPPRFGGPSDYTWGP